MLFDYYLIFLVDMESFGYFHEFQKPLHLDFPSLPNYGQSVIYSKWYFPFTLYEM